MGDCVGIGVGVGDMGTAVVAAAGEGDGEGGRVVLVWGAREALVVWDWGAAVWVAGAAV